MADGFELSLKGLAKKKAQIAALPGGAGAAMKAELENQMGGLVAAMKANAPFDPDNEEHAHLRESVHFYPNPKRAIGFIVLADAKDADGKFIGSNIEAGHRAPDGQHVAASPFFFPTWRALRKGIRAAVMKVARANIRKAWGQ